MSSPWVVSLSLALNAVGLVAMALGAWLVVYRRAQLATWIFEPARERLRSFFDASPIRPGDIVLLGDSLTSEARWDELLPGLPLRNRGVPGDTTADVLRRLGGVTSGSPAKVFLLIGTNDLSRRAPLAEVSRRYSEILARLQGDSPSTRIYALSVLPREARRRLEVEALNREIERLARAHGAVFVDLYPRFLGPDGSLRPDLSNDGLHLLGPGYAVWSEALRPFLSDTHAKVPRG